MRNGKDLPRRYFNLIRSARRASKRAYAPYSGFKVGAAVLAGSHSIYTGCNVENASYGLSICAERVAVFKAISEGEKRIEAIAVAADGPSAVSPCGACRQVIFEFNRKAVVLMSNLKGETVVDDATRLLPRGFSRLRK